MISQTSKTIRIWPRKMYHEKLYRCGITC